MERKEHKRMSKFMSLVLRHQPELIGLELDKNGWAKTAELIEKSKSKELFYTHEIIKEIVETNDKKRFSFNEDNKSILKKFNIL